MKNMNFNGNSVLFFFLLFTQANILVLSFFLRDKQLVSIDNLILLLCIFSTLYMTYKSYMEYIRLNK